MSTLPLCKGSPNGPLGVASQTVQQPILPPHLGELHHPTKLHRSIVSGRTQPDLAPRKGAGTTRAADVASGPPDDSDDAKMLPQKEKLLTIPTVLTLFRVVLVPAIVPVFYASPSAAAAIFLLASITDWLDGYLARKFKSSSEFGAFLDPVADKLMVAAVLVLLCTEPHRFAALPDWAVPVPVIAIISREIAMSALREWAAGQGPALREVVAVSSLGKWKTATQLTALNLLLLARMSLDPNVLLFSFTVGLGFLYVASGLTVWSFALYGAAIWRKLK